MPQRKRIEINKTFLNLDKKYPSLILTPRGISPCIIIKLEWNVSSHVQQDTFRGKHSAIIPKLFNEFPPIWLHNYYLGPIVIPQN